MSKNDSGQTVTPVANDVVSTQVYKTASATATPKPQPAPNTTQQTPYVPPVVRYKAPGGYSGPVNGPFTWAGVGEPPNGAYTTIGIPVTQ